MPYLPAICLAYITWSIAGELYYILCIVFNAPIIVLQHLLLLQSTTAIHTPPNILLATTTKTSSQTSTNLLHLVYLRVYFYARTRKMYVFWQACGYARENRNYLIDRFMYLLYYRRSGSNDVCLFKFTTKLAATFRLLLYIESERDIF